MGAWIETFVISVMVSWRIWSHPTWVRGLKLELYHRYTASHASHPTWVRGLKHSLVNFSIDVYNVAPYVGAWIETAKIPQD